MILISPHLGKGRKAAVLLLRHRFECRVLGSLPGAAAVILGKSGFSSKEFETVSLRGEKKHTHLCQVFPVARANAYRPQCSDEWADGAWSSLAVPPLPLGPLWSGLLTITCALFASFLFVSVGLCVRGRRPRLYLSASTVSCLEWWARGGLAEIVEFGRYFFVPY